MLPCSDSSLHRSSLPFFPPLLPAGEKCLLARLPDTERRYQPCLALYGNEPPGAVLSVYDKDINNTVL